MSLKPQPIGPVPEDTVQVAQSAFPQGNTYMRMRDEFGSLFSDPQFAALFPTRGRPAQAPWRLALVTIMQYAEGLSDRQAADAVRSRIDWKYVLGLALSDPGFNFSVLSEFRDRFVEQVEALFLQALLEQFRARKLLKARGRQRTDSTHVLGAIRGLNRLECAGETLRHTLNQLDVVAPQWLQTHSPKEWVDRYGARLDEYRFPDTPAQRQTLAETIGQDGYRL
jgi:transposase